MLHYRRWYLVSLFFYGIVGTILIFFCLHHPRTQEDIFHFIPPTHFSTSPGNFLAAYLTSLPSSLESIESYRIAFHAPIGLIQWVLGVNLTSYYTAAILMTLFFFCSIFWSLKEIFGLKISLMVGIVFLPSIFAMHGSSLVLPYGFASGWVLLGFAFFHRAIYSYPKKQRRWHFLLTVIAALWVYFSQEWMLLGFLCLPIYEWYCKRSLTSSGIFLLFLFIFIVLESFLIPLLLGYPSTHWGALMQGFFQDIPNQPAEPTDLNWFEYIYRYPIQIMGYGFTGGIYLHVFLISILIAIVLRYKKLIGFLLGIGVVFMVYNFAFIQWEPLYPLFSTDLAYLPLVWVFMSLSIALVFYRLVSYLTRRKSLRWLRFAILLVFLSTLVGLNVHELPAILEESLWFHKDDWWVLNSGAAQLNPSSLDSAKGYYDAPAISEPSFEIFPHLKALHFQQPFLYENPPQHPFYILFTTDSIQQQILSTHSKIAAYYLQNMLYPTLPDWEILVNYKNYRMVVHCAEGINTKEIESLALFEDLLSWQSLRSSITFGKPEFAQLLEENTQGLHVAITNTGSEAMGVFIFTNQHSRKFLKNVPLLWINPVFDRQITVEYTVAKPLTRLSIRINEFDSMKKNLKHTDYRLKKFGYDRFSTILTPQEQTKILSIMFSYSNSENDNELIIHSLQM